MVTDDAQERKGKREYIGSQLMTNSEVIDFLGITRQGLNRYTKTGRLQPVKYGVFLKDDVIAFKKAYNEARNKKEYLADFE